MPSSVVSDAGDETLVAMFEAARRQWPKIVVEPNVFRAYVEERTPAAADRPSLRAAELYLACACAHGDERALAVLDERYLLPASSVLGEASHTQRFVDDVRQRLRERLFVQGKIRQYSGRGALASWLRVVTLRVASNMRAPVGRHQEISDSLPGAAADPELALLQQRYGDAFRTALHDAIGALGSEERTILRLYYQEGLNIGAIARVLGVSRATIGRRMIAMREKLIADTYALLGARLNATAEELESLLRVVRSNLAVSVSGALADR
jgi:RNA polymerase sigma-70 factor (ECF subfamily)